jgi:prolipoprotein diacylglyceryltransferase
MREILFEWGFIRISTLGIFILAGFLFGYWLSVRLLRAHNVITAKERVAVFDAALYTFVIGLLGAHIWAALSIFGFTRAAWGGLWAVQSPLVFMGGLITGFGTWRYFGRRIAPSHLPVWLACGFAAALSALAVGKVGQYLGGASFGKAATTLAVNGTFALEIVQAIGFAGAAYFTIVFLKKGNPALALRIGSAAMLFTYFVTSFFSVPGPLSSPLWGLALDQWLEIFAIVLVLGGWQWMQNRRKRH